MNQDPQSSTPDKDKRAISSISNKRWLIVTAALLLAGVVLIGPMAATTTPQFYERYPKLRERIKGWQRSTHAYMACTSCHIEPGLGQTVSFAAKSIPTFYSQLFSTAQSPGIMNKAPSKEACLKCHTSVRKISPGGDLRIPHRAHVEVLKLECTVCHGKLVHWPNPKGHNTPAMEGCLNRCHNGKKAPNACLKCHTNKAVPESHKAADWLAIHSKKTHEIKCGTCHGWSPDLCGSCHRRKPTTHVGNWKKLHQYRAEQRGNGCLVCHGGKKFCLKCHDAGLFDKPIFKEGK